MNGGTLQLVLVLLFGGLLGAALPVSPIWYLIPLLIVAFLAMMAAGKKVREREFLVLSLGELLVAAAGTGVPWSVLPLQVLLAGIFLAELQLLPSRSDAAWFGVFILGAAASFALILGTRNILLSCVVAGGVLLCILLGLKVREHEQLRVLAGGSP
jgi:hypothetical protein